MSSNNYARIHFDLSPISFEEAEKIRGDILALLEAGAFSTKNGNVTMHFDHNGTLQCIDIFQRKWKRVSKPEETAVRTVFFTGSTRSESDEGREVLSQASFQHRA